MKTGTTLEVLRRLGNIPVSKDLLISFEIGIEISSQMSFRILIGMLLGPLDFEAEKDLIILMTSSGLTGLRKIEFGLPFLRKSEKWRLEGGIADLTFSATDVKKSLKVLATVSGSEDMVLPIDKEMGLSFRL